MRSATTDSRNAKNYAHWNNHSLQNTEEEPSRGWNDLSRNQRTHEVPFIADCNHFTRKNRRFGAPASSPKQSPCNIHAAITMRFAASRSKPAFIYAHGNTRWQQSCSHSNAICNHRFKKRIELRTQEQPLLAEYRGRTNSRMKSTAAATAANRRYLSSLAATILHGKTEGFVLRLPPQHKPHATFMQPLQRVSQHHVANLHVATHMATPDDNNHVAISNAICNHRFKKRKELCTLEQPVVAEHRGGTKSRMKRDRGRNRRTHEVPFIAGCNHFTRKNRRFGAPASSTTSPMQHSCSHHNAFCSITWLTRMYLRTWQHQMTTIIQPLHECIVVWCQVSHHSLTPPFIECILMWCKVSHRPSLGKSHP